MSDIILHHYESSPFTQKALKMLAVKGVVWRSVITPEIVPKPDLTVLTGGYRGTPVMQIGADIYIDSQLIAVELERRFPDPSFFPNGNVGMPLALDAWGEVFFQAGLIVAVALSYDQWPDDFKADRQVVFPKTDFEAMKADLSHAAAQLRAHAGFVNAQLADGRAFLQGAAPGMADIQAFSVPWFLRAYAPDLTAKIWGDYPFLAPWEDRMAAVGQGTRTDIDAYVAHAAALAATPLPGHGVDDAEAQDLTVGMMVEIAPVDSQRGTVQGALITAQANEVAVARHDPAVGDVAVHFPRIGYRITAV